MVIRNRFLIFFDGRTGLIIGQLTVTATLAVTTTVRSPLTRLLSPPAVVAVAAAVTASPALARRKRSDPSNERMNPKQNHESP